MVIIWDGELHRCLSLGAFVDLEALNLTLFQYQVDQGWDHSQSQSDHKGRAYPNESVTMNRSRPTTSRNQKMYDITLAMSHEPFRLMILWFFILYYHQEKFDSYLQNYSHFHQPLLQLSMCGVSFKKNNTLTSKNWMNRARGFISKHHCAIWNTHTT